MTHQKTKEVFFFERVLQLAEKGWGKTHPNPMVGALIEEDGGIVAEGYHRACGEAHAEVEALKILGRNPKSSARLFVSLEPCSNQERTPPCTRAIIESGIRKVFLSTTDPNPIHSGRGIDILRKAGIQVFMADEESNRRAERLNFIFNHNMIKGLPMIALKMAESANGMVSGEAGSSTRITGEQARADVMRWRRLFSAICVGSGTVLSDDPKLTSRREDEVWCPIRLVVDSHLSTLQEDVSDRKLYTDQFSDFTLILTTSIGMRNWRCMQRARNLGIEVKEVEMDEGGRASPTFLRNVLRELGLNSVFLEGGPTIARSLLEAGEIDYLFRYRSRSKLLGPNAVSGLNLNGCVLRNLIKDRWGDDTLEHGFL